MPEKIYVFTRGSFTRGVFASICSKVQRQIFTLFVVLKNVYRNGSIVAVKVVLHQLSRLEWRRISLKICCFSPSFLARCDSLIGHLSPSCLGTCLAVLRGQHVLKVELNSIISLVNFSDFSPSDDVHRSVISPTRITRATRTIITAGLHEKIRMKANIILTFQGSKPAILAGIKSTDKIGVHK